MSIFLTCQVGRLNLRLLLVFCALFILTSCQTRSYTTPHSEVVAEAHSQGMRIHTAEQERRKFYQYEEKSRKRLRTLMEKRESSGLASRGYRIGNGDKIEVNVFDVPELNVEVRVRDSGFISLPLIGALQASGRTESELQDELKERLVAYVKQPQLSVYISEYGSQKVSVLGAVREPGAYAIKRGGNTLLEVISEAGGITESAGNYLHLVPVEVTSQSGSDRVSTRAQLSMNRFSRSGGSHGIELYLEQVLGTSGDIPLDLPIRGGDMIIIPEAGNVLVEGEVEKRGSYELGKRMTLLGALAAAGGITSAAKVDEVEVVRAFAPGERARLILSLEHIMTGAQSDVNLRNGDIIRVPSHSGRRMSEDTIRGIKEFLNIGVGASVSP